MAKISASIAAIKASHGNAANQPRLFEWALVASAYGIVTAGVSVPFFIGLDVCAGGEESDI